MLFSQIIPPSLSPTESKSLFFTSVAIIIFKTHVSHSQQTLFVHDLCVKKLSAEW